MAREVSEKEILTELFAPEEGGERPEVAPEVERIERALYQAAQPASILDDAGQPLVSSPAPQTPKVVLPITKQKYLFGFSQPIVYSIRWLVEWAKRLLKMWPQGVVFREAEA
jgi:hypothetical protein